jgi:hypothetical protein
VYKSDRFRSAGLSYITWRLKTEEMIGELHAIDMELTTAEKRRVEEEELRCASEKQYRAKVRADLQGGFAPAHKSGLAWLFSVGLVLVVAAIWYVHFGS